MLNKKNTLRQYRVIAGLAIISVFTLFSCSPGREEIIAKGRIEFMKNCDGSNSPYPIADQQKEYAKKFCPCAWEALMQDKEFVEIILSGKNDIDGSAFAEKKNKEGFFDECIESSK